MKIVNDAAGIKHSQRVKYQLDFGRKNNNKRTIFIVDESDAIISRNAEEFWTKINYEKVFVICLTATPFEVFNDDHEGLMERLLKELDFKTYSISDKAEDFKPKITMSKPFGNLEAWSKFIKEESAKCGVVVYANEP